jgi:hypothetical protein
LADPADNAPAKRDLQVAVIDYFEALNEPI